MPLSLSEPQEGGDKTKGYKGGELWMERGEDQIRMIWKRHFEDLCNMDTQEERLQLTCVALMVFRAN